MMAAFSDETLMSHQAQAWAWGMTPGVDKALTLCGGKVSGVGRCMRCEDVPYKHFWGCLEETQVEEGGRWRQKSPPPKCKACTLL
jgi:hypothetical protein